MYIFTRIPSHCELLLVMTIKDFLTTKSLQFKSCKYFLHEHNRNLRSERR